MKNDKTLKIGDIAITLGYYEANDGGGAEYKIKLSTEKYGEILNNNLIAELIFKERINIDTLGGKSNEENFDNSQIFLKAFSICENVICGYNKKYFFKNVVDLSSLSDKKFDFNLNGSTLSNFFMKIHLDSSGFKSRTP